MSLFPLSFERIGLFNGISFKYQTIDPIRPDNAVIVSFNRVIDDSDLRIERNGDSIIEIPNAWDKHLLPCGEWETPVGAMHGMAHGEVRKKSGDMDLFQSSEGPDSIYPDGLIADEGINQIDALAKAEKPFFLAIGLIKPHLPFGAPAEYMKPYKGKKLPSVPHPEKSTGKTTWHKSGEFMKYNRWGEIQIPMKHFPRRSAATTPPASPMRTNMREISWKN